MLTCTATNMNGKASAKVFIAVHGRPSVPEGLLEVANMSRDGCRLQWEASKCNGGLSIEYVAEKFKVGGDSWTRAGATTNLYFDIGDLESFREYDFRVKAVNEAGESECLQVVKTVLAKDKFSKNSWPLNLTFWLYFGFLTFKFPRLHAFSTQTQNATACITSP
jgi:hypothetical protein